MKRLLNMVCIAFSFRGVTIEQKLRQSFDPDSIDRMPKIGPGFSMFHYESLLSKVYRRGTNPHQSRGLLE